MLTTRRDVDDGVSTCAGRAAPSRIGPTVMPLPPAVRAKFAGADGKPDAAFANLYEALQETEPKF